MSDEVEFPIVGTPRMPPGVNALYVPNRRSFGAFMKSEQIREPVAKHAKAIALKAAELTPASVPGPNSTGLHSEVKGGFTVKVEAGTIVVDGNRRVKVEVENKVHGAGLVEFGARGLKRVRMLGRAGALSPGDFKPDGGPS